jgi:hypothetical protein
MDRITDKHGAVLVPNRQQRIRRLYPNGQPIKGGTSYLLGLHWAATNTASMVPALSWDEGRIVLDYEELVSLKLGTTTPDRVEVLRSSFKNPTHAEKQYRVDKNAAADVSKAVSKRRAGALR